MSAHAADIRPFTFNVSNDQLDDLRRRVTATRWPEGETVPGDSQGVRLATVQNLARYWADGYDWRKSGEAKLKAVPHFVTEIDGLDIHFVHVRSKHKDALPMLVTHGWPGSIIEQLKIVGPLTDPTMYGASAEDAFDLVIPSLPGHGFSAKPDKPGWDPIRIARAWAEPPPVSPRSCGSPRSPRTIRSCQRRKSWRSSPPSSPIRVPSSRATSPSPAPPRW